MEILIWAIVGLVAGWLASMIMGTNRALTTNILLGVVGAVLGGFILNLFGAPGVTGLDLWSIAVATLGAVVLIALGRTLRTA
jgi:uncharacterized membrane protein YeaQ/YmgE (transglycosylase-associated protein family)